jgi:hypothetical protein
MSAIRTDLTDSVVAQVFEAGGETTDVHSLTSGGLDPR